MKTTLYLLTAAFLISCQSTVESPNTASVVEIRNDSGRYQLYVNQIPFEVKGAGLDFNVGQNFKALAEAGANSFRTWRTKNGQQQLDSAAKYDLMVAMGLDIEKELHGFDYDDEIAVAHQLDRVKKAVDQYKDHPNLLCWVAGNELNLLFNEDGTLKLVNPKTYVALKDIVAYIREVDPNHPVTTTFAGINPTHIALAQTHGPELDFYSYQVYGDLARLPEVIKENNLNFPYMITEYGPMGHWERPATAWGREIEEPSGPKALGLWDRIQNGLMQENSGYQIGNYAFLWGQKQERTPTWYGMFNKSGEATARVDVMTRFWTGAYPDNRAPLADSLQIDGQNPVDNVYLAPGTVHQAQVKISDPDNDELQIDWVMLKEVGTRSQGGAFEQEPEAIAFEITKNEGQGITFKTPSQSGDYRLFMYAYDGNGHVGNANFPFYIK